LFSAAPPTMASGGAESAASSVGSGR
jgi:hypothetical protein